MGAGDAQIALEEKGAVRRKRPERKGWVERKGREGGKQTASPPPSCGLETEIRVKRKGGKGELEPVSRRGWNNL